MNARDILFLIGLLSFFATTNSVFSQELPKPKTIDLVLTKAPVDDWKKGRIEARLVGNKLRLSDKGSGALQDSTFWQIEFARQLPYGRKEFSVSIKVGASHKPLWGTSLLQPILNGKEAQLVLRKDGKPEFEKNIADDGKGFITANTGIYRFQMKKSDKILQSFSFMTAGADGFDVTMEDFQVKVWTEEENKIRQQRPRVSSLGFHANEKKTLFVEWYDDDVSQKKEKASVSIKGPNGKASYRVTLPVDQSKASDSRVSQIDISGIKKQGTYEFTVPSFGKEITENTVSFSVHKSNNYLEGLRDEAWGTFYWITDGENGPYPDAHKQDIAAKVFGKPTKTQDVRGGWFDAGDYGKYSVNGAYSVSLILLHGLLSPHTLDHSIEPKAGSSGGQPDWVTVASEQLDWLYKMQREDGAVYHKVATKDWPSLTEKPEGDTAVKWLMPVSSTATANFAATMALASQVMARFGNDQSKKKGQAYLAASKKAQQWLVDNPQLTMIKQSYDGADYGGPYYDEHDQDERFFALASLAAVSDNPVLIAEAEAQLQGRKNIFQKEKYDLHWARVDLLGFWALKVAEDKLSRNGRLLVDAALKGAADEWHGLQNRSHWNLPMDDGEGFGWGSNGALATIGWHWLLWADVSGESKYVQSARSLLHWFFGQNPLSKTFVSGDYLNALKNPHFRPSVSGAITLPAGFLSGGPNSYTFVTDPVSAQLKGRPPMGMYIDDVESYTTNEVAINWQVPWALFTSLIVASY